MQAIDTAALKTIEQDILAFIDQVCRQNHLRYSMSGGTLLGAVRHKGYIPWDDDIDIFLPRPDYEKLLVLIQQKSTKYKVISCFTQRDYFLPFAKVIDTSTGMRESYSRTISGYGVYVDVFPVDGLPIDPVERTRYWNKIRIWKRLNTMVYQKRAKKEQGAKRLLRSVVFTLLRPFPANLIAKKLNRMALRHPYRRDTLVATSVFGYGRKEEQDGTTFDHLVEMPFESYRFFGIASYDTYLHNLYGNYMQLPPKEQQVAKHSFEAWYR